MSGTALSIPMRRTELPAAATESEIISVAQGTTEWTIRADLVGELLPAICAAIENRAPAGAVEIVKTGPHRSVYRLSLAAEGDFYLKHFRAADRLAHFLNLLRPTKAAREWNAARNVARLGIPTFEPVAVGMQSRGALVCDSFLVSRAIANSQPLDRFVTENLLSASVSETRVLHSRAIDQGSLGGVRSHSLARASGWCAGAGGQSVLRQRLAVALGELLARLHRAGIEHADLHAANVLVRIDADGSPELFLIDLHPVHLRNALSTGQRLANLSLFHQFFAGRSTRADRLRFYRAYWQELQRGNRNLKNVTPPTVTLHDLPAADDEMATLERMLTFAADRGWKRADRAWRRGNRHVRKRDGGGVSCRGLATLDVAWLDSVRDDPERMFRDNLVRWHKQSSKHRVAEIRLPESASAPAFAAFLKCIEERGAWRRCLAHFRNSPVRRCWEVGHAFLRRGIDTPRPILFVERLEADSRKLYLLTEAIPASRTAAEFFAKSWPTLSDHERSAWLEAHLARLARQLRRMHDAGFDHRDLKFSNLLVAGDLTDPRIWFLDLDGVRCWRKLPANRAAQNLARIEVSAGAHGVGTRADRVRFLRRYLGEKFAEEWKWWWRRIEKVSKTKIAGNIRRKRPIT